MREMVQAAPRDDMFGAASRFFHLNVRWGDVNLHFILKLERGRDAVQVEPVGGGLLRVVEVRPGKIVERCHGDLESIDEIAGRWRHGRGSGGV